MAINNSITEADPENRIPLPWALWRKQPQRGRLPDIAERSDIPNADADVDNYGSITAEGPHMSSTQQLLKSLMGNIGPAFTGGEHPVTGTEGMGGPTDAGRKAAELAVPISTAVGGMASKLPRIPLALRALSRMYTAPGAIPRVAGVLGVGAGTAALVGGGQEGLPESNHAPAATPAAPVAGPRAQPAQPAQADTYIPEELQAMVAQEPQPQPPIDYTDESEYNQPAMRMNAQIPAGQAPDYTDEADYAQPAMRMGDESQAAQPSGARDINQEMADILSPGVLLNEPIQQKIADRSQRDLDELTKERDVSQKEPKSFLGKFVRGVSKLATNMSAPGGSYDPTRYDSLQAELENKRRQYTPQQALRGGLATEDVRGTREFNRQAQSKQQDTGGLTDAGKLSATMEMQKNERAAGRTQQKELKDLELRNRAAEIGLSASVNQKYTKEQSMREFVKQYPDADPELTSQLFDLSQNPAYVSFLHSVQKGREGKNPAEDMIALLRAMKEYREEKTMPPKKEKSAPELVIRSLGAKK